MNRVSVISSLQFSSQKFTVINRIKLLWSVIIYTTRQWGYIYVNIWLEEKRARITLSPSTVYHSMRRRN